GAELADQDVAGLHELAAVAFDAPSLTVRIAPVAGAALTLFMCHELLRRLASDGDGGDLERRERLAMAAALAIVLAALVLENDDLARAILLDDLGGHLGPAHQRLAQLDLLVVGAARDHEHVREGHRLTGVAGQLLDPYGFTFGDPILFAAGLNHRIHC